jgi:hypothetical protein
LLDLVMRDWRVPMPRRTRATNLRSGVPPPGGGTGAGRSAGAGGRRRAGAGRGDGVPVEGPGPDRPWGQAGHLDQRARRAGGGQTAHQGAGDRTGLGQAGREAVRGGVRPKATYPVIAELAGQGFSAKRCCRILGVAASGFFMWRRRSPSPRQLRLAWLTDLVRTIHADSRGTYGWRRVNAELTYGHGVIVNRKTVRKIMRAQGLHGLPGARRSFRSRPTSRPPRTWSSAASTARPRTSCG